MQVEMFVRIDVIKVQARRRKCLELGTDFRCQLAPHVRQKEIAETLSNHGLTEHAVRVDQIRNTRWRQDGLAVGQHEVQPHRQTRKSSGTFDSIGHGGRRNHQAGRLQYALAIGALHRFIDSLMKPIVICGDDQARAYRCDMPGPHGRLQRHVER